MATYVAQNLHEHPTGWGDNGQYYQPPMEYHAPQPTQEVVLCGGEGGVFPLHGTVRQVAIKHRWDEGPDKIYPLQIWSSPDRKTWQPLGSLRDAQDFAELFPVGDGVRYVRVVGGWSSATKCHVELAATS